MLCFLIPGISNLWPTIELHIESIRYYDEGSLLLGIITTSIQPVGRITKVLSNSNHSKVGRSKCIWIFPLSIWIFPLTWGLLWWDRTYMKPGWTQAFYCDWIPWYFSSCKTTKFKLVCQDHLRPENGKPLTSSYSNKSRSTDRGRSDPPAWQIICTTNQVAYKFYNGS